MSQFASSLLVPPTAIVIRRTVTTHTSVFYAKLGVASRTGAAALAIREGLV